MREIITFNVGQCGAQLGDRFFALIGKESNLDASGKPLSSDPVNDMIFQETYQGSYSPRALFVDAEPSAVDNVIMTSEIKQAYTDDFLITGDEDSQGCYARGKFATAKAILPRVCAQFRRALEQCEGISVIRILHSVGGGTGSGFSTALLCFLDDIVSNVDRHLHTIIPNAQVDTGTEIVNTVLSLAQTEPLHNIRAVYDNASIVDRLTPVFPRSISPTFSDINMLPSMVLSNLSIHSSKTGGEMDMNQIARNLICYPRIKMVSAAFAPFLQQNSQFEMNAFAMTSEIFQPGQECCALDTSSGAYFTAWLQYRGDFNPWNIYQTKAKILHPGRTMDIQFKSWIPHFIKQGLVKDAMEYPKEFPNKSKRSILKISNHTNMSKVTDVIISAYTKMLDSRAFLFWYNSNGQEDHEFNEAKDTILEINEEIEHLSSDVKFE